MGIENKCIKFCFFYSLKALLHRFCSIISQELQSLYEAFVEMGVVGGFLCIACTEKGKSGDMFVPHPSKPLYLFPFLQKILEEKHQLFFPIKIKDLKITVSAEPELSETLLAPG